MMNKRCGNSECSYIPFRINKIDEATGAGIAGAVFELIPDHGSAFRGMTDSNGSLILGVLPCAGYQLREISPPVGYAPENHVYNISVNVCGCIFVDGVLISQLIISNTAITGSFTAIKVNIEDNVPLAGAVYTLFMNSTEVDSAASDAAGKLSFTALSPGIYELVETVPPPGFQANGDRFSVVVAQNGSVTIDGEPANGFILRDVPISEFVFRKLDASTELPLAGAVFTISQNDMVIDTITSDADGLVDFGTLAPGTYQLLESVVPPGFQPNSTVYEVVAATDGSITVDGILLGEFVVLDTPIAISAPPIIDTITEGDTTITGTGVSGSAIMVTLPSGSVVNATVSIDGAWMANVPDGEEISAGEIVSANQTETGKVVSEEVYIIVISNPEVEPGIDVFVENLSTGLDFAQAGDIMLHDAIISNNGTASSLWQSAYATFFLDSVVTLQTSTIRINNRVADPGQYSYDSTANTLTFYLGDISGGSNVGVSYRVVVNTDISDINEIILEVTLGSLA